MEARFLGLDLAWVPGNPSGLAALDANGRLIDVRCDLRSDAELVDWIREHLRDRGAIAIDMPTIVPNPTGQRPCERDLRRDFHTHDAAPYPANLGLAPFAGGGRARRILAELQAHGVVESINIEPRDPRIVAFEAFPHAAAVRLFGLSKILKYKKKRRPWPGVLEAWAAYRRLLASLEDADPPLVLDPRLLPFVPMQRRYKCYDDAIDAVVCAYVASYVWRHGTAGPAVRAYGDMQCGHIVTPWEPPWMERTPGGYSADLNR